MPVLWLWKATACRGVESMVDDKAVQSKSEPHQFLIKLCYLLSLRYHYDIPLHCRVAIIVFYVAVHSVMHIWWNCMLYAYKYNGQWWKIYRVLTTAYYFYVKRNNLSISNEWVSSILRSRMLIWINFVVVTEHVFIKERFKPLNFKFDLRLTCHYSEYSFITYFNRTRNIIILGYCLTHLNLKKCFFIHWSWKFQRVLFYQISHQMYT